MDKDSKGRLIIKRGDKFGRLTILSELPRKRSKGGTPRRLFLCRCECGNTKEVDIRSLVTGDIISCGCYRHEWMQTTFVKHGLKRHPLYQVWKGIRQRCNNMANKSYPKYGGRGIHICQEWNNFKTFYDWSIVNGYSAGLSIDRINNDEDYSPDNCRWTDMKTQARNRRNNIILQYGNRVWDSISSFCEEVNLSYNSVWRKIYNGHSFEDVLLSFRGNPAVDAILFSNK